MHLSLSLYIYIYIYICVWVGSHAFVYLYLYLSLSLSLSLSLYIYIYMRVYVYIYILYTPMCSWIYVYIYIYIYIYAAAMYTPLASCTCGRAHSWIRICVWFLARCREIGLMHMTVPAVPFVRFGSEVIAGMRGWIDTGITHALWRLRVYGSRCISLSSIPFPSSTFPSGSHLLLYTSRCWFEWCV